MLALTEAGVALLKDASVRPELTLARQRRVDEGPPPRRARGPTPRRGRTSITICSSACARVRLRIARERGVPPYVIFHDTTLRELARLKPRRVEELQTVKGIGARKAEQLGEAFVDEIRSYVVQSHMTNAMTMPKCVLRHLPFDIDIDNDSLSSLQLHYSLP